MPHHIPIIDNQESLVDLKSEAFRQKSDIRFVFGEAGLGAIDDNFRLRETAGRKLFEAERILKKNFGANLTFKVTDTFRPIDLQKKYFEKVKAEIIEKEGLTADELYHRIIQFIADPDDTPPHCTGGAVDLTIFDLNKNEEFDMGTKIDEISDLAQTNHPKIIGKQKGNRGVLLSVMAEAGFVNSPYEWWHYSYGEKWWAMLTNQGYAVYGVL